MTTKAELISQFKKDYPTITRQDDDVISELNASEYEATIESWADYKLESEAKALKAITDKAELLAKLGITADEAKLLLS